MSKVEVSANQKAARMSRIVGFGGALAIMALAVGLCYWLQGQINIYALLGAGFFAVFHIIGCELFTAHFKALDKEAGE